MSITAAEQDRIAARLAEIRPFLDERAWRLLLGAEARAIGDGGMKVVAAAAKAKADTVSRVGMTSCFGPTVTVCFGPTLGRGRHRPGTASPISPTAR